MKGQVFKIINDFYETKNYQEILPSEKLFQKQERQQNALITQHSPSCHIHPRNWFMYLIL